MVAQAKPATPRLQHTAGLVGVTLDPRLHEMQRYPNSAEDMAEVVERFGERPR